MTEASLLDRLRAAQVPEGLHDGLTQFILHGRPMGHFLTAVCSNNLSEACNRADTTNKYRLYDIIHFLFNCAPVECWGSKERIEAWTAKRGLENKPPA